MIPPQEMDGEPSTEWLEAHANNGCGHLEINRDGRKYLVSITEVPP